MFVCIVSLFISLGCVCHAYDSLMQEEVVKHKEQAKVLQAAEQQARKQLAQLEADKGSAGAQHQMLERDLQTMKDDIARLTRERELVLPSL